MVKNISKLLLIIGTLYVWLPTGPSALVIQPYIIDKIGMTMYIILSILFVFLVYRWIEGKGFTEKFNTVKREITTFLKGMDRGVLALAVIGLVIMFFERIK